MRSGGYDSDEETKVRPRRRSRNESSRDVLSSEGSVNVEGELLRVNHLMACAMKGAKGFCSGRVV